MPSRQSWPEESRDQNQLEYNQNCRYSPYLKLSGAAEARRAHNPEGNGSKPFSAIEDDFFFAFFGGFPKGIFCPSFATQSMFTCPGTFVQVQRSGWIVFLTLLG